MMMILVTRFLIFFHEVGLAVAAQALAIIDGFLNLMYISGLYFMYTKQQRIKEGDRTLWCSIPCRAHKQLEHCDKNPYVFFRIVPARVAIQKAIYDLFKSVAAWADT